MASGRRDKKLLAQCKGKTNHVAMSNYSGIADWCVNHFGVGNASGGVTFSPLTLANCIQWFDGNDAASFSFSSGVKISQWNDKSGLDDHIVQATTDNQPDYDSGTGRVTFNGTSDFLRSSGNFTGGAESITTVAVVFQAVKPNAASTAVDFILDGRTGTNDRQVFFLQVNGGAVEDNISIFNGTTVLSSGVLYNAGHHIAIMEFNTTDFMHYDGGAPIVSGDGGSHSLNGISMGAAFDDSGTYTGHVNEVVVYSEAKSDGDKNLLGNYLADKWNVVWRDIGSGYQPDIPGQRGRHNAGSGITKISGKVSAWEDSSGNKNNFFQLTASKRPVFTASDSAFNDLPVITFDGTDDSLTTSTFKSGDMAHPNTVFMVARWDTQVDDTFAFDGLSEDGGNAYYSNSSSNDTLDSGRDPPAQGIPTTVTAHIYNIEFNGASHAMYIDGGTADLTGNGGTDPLDGLTLGADFAGANNGAITIAEIIVYDTLVSVTDANTIGNDLATRYGLTWTNRT